MTDKRRNVAIRRSKRDAFIDATCEISDAVFEEVVCYLHNICWRQGREGRGGLALYPSTKEENRVDNLRVRLAGFMLDDGDFRTLCQLACGISKAILI